MRRTTIVPALVSALVLAMAGTAQGAPVASTPVRPTPVAPPARPSAPVPGGDEVVTGYGDLEGYHIYAAARDDGFAWHPLASLLPAGDDDESWTGQQCLTGDGRTVVAVIAPWHADNSEAGMDHGGYAYAIDAHTGAVRPLATGASLAYFDPGCGSAGEVALTSYLATDEAVTRISVVDMSAGRVSVSTTVAGELTSAAVIGGRTLAARGDQLLAVNGTGVTTLTTASGPISQIHPASGGATFVTGSGAAAQLWRWTPTRLTKIGGGPAGRLRTFGGELVAGATTLSAGTAAVAPAGATVDAAASGFALVEGATTHDNEVWTSRGGGAPVKETLPTPARTTLAVPAVALDAATAPAAATPQASGRPAAGAVPAGVAAPNNATTPTCAVGRNNIYQQVFQPDADQVRWAINQAVQGVLKSPYTSVKRPTGNAMYAVNSQAYTALPTAYADVDFPVVAGAPAVPPLVMYGILAQESNWAQASWHAVPGRSGNPLIANYYGTAPVPDPEIDYDEADCGYGIAQVTDGMTATGPLPSAQQARVAVDYATNIAAGVQILQTKWMQLHQLGITMNDDDPTKVENWYGAIWGYNSGVHTDPGTYQGLGWFNNPANQMWLPGRHTFLHVDTSTSLTDASHPNDWPYQERVFGWMEVPLMTSDNVLDYRGTYDWDTGVGTFLVTPSVVKFCAPAVNNCDPGVLGGSDPCPDEDGRCYWDVPVTWTDCATSCVTDTVTNAPNGHTYHTTPGDPEPTQAPAPVTCSISSNSPGANAVVVDDETLNGENPSKKTPNLMGCASPDSGLIPAAGANASFTLLDADNNDVMTTPSSVGAIDAHQLGGGIGGHLFFTHTSSAEDPGYATDGQWRATLTANKTYGTAYEIKVFVPDIGAATGHATYEISTVGSAGSPLTLYRTISQASYRNQWVSLGYYLCGMQTGAATDTSCTMTVKLNTVTPDDDSTQGADVAFDAVAFVPVPTGRYVALGDSISSGEGVQGGFLDGTDVAKNESNNAIDHGNLCHVSPQAWPSLLGTAKGFPVINLACSGSNLGDLTGYDQQYWVNETIAPLSFLGVSAPWATITTFARDTTASPPIEPGTVVGGPNQPPAGQGDNWFEDVPVNNEQGGSAWFGEFSTQLLLAKALRPRFVTLTIGGNDLGFADILLTCLSHSLPRLPEGCYGDLGGTTATGHDGVYNRIQSLKPLLQQAYADVAAAVGGANRVTVVTYPNIIKYVATLDPLSMDCTSLYNDDEDWLSPDVTAFDDAIVSAAHGAGVHVIDERSAFSGKEVCQPNSDVTGPDWTIWDLPNSLNESVYDNWFHPNASGYAAMASSIGNQITIPTS